jgi:hypothetical protein
MAPAISLLSSSSPPGSSQVMKKGAGAPRGHVTRADPGNGQGKDGSVCDDLSPGKLFCQGAFAGYNESDAILSAKIIFISG